MKSPRPLMRISRSCPEASSNAFLPMVEVFAAKAKTSKAKEIGMR
jgi:hypothetical protein